MNREQAILARALGDAIKERLSRAGPGAYRVEFPGPANVINVPESPPPKVENFVEGAQVTVNLDADALAAALATALRPLLEMVGGAVEMMAAVVRERRSVEATAPVEPRGPRVAHIQHGDGSTATITLE